MSWLWSENFFQLIIFVMFIWATQNSNGFDGFTEITWFFKNFILFLPKSEFLILNHRLKLFNSSHVFFEGWSFDRFLNEVKLINFFFKLFQSENYWSNQNSNTWKFSVVQRVIDWFFLLKLLFSTINFVNEKIHYFDSFLFNTSSNAISLS